ncbi:hypothetical protein LWI29_013442 [Acer saccharum]|uniref:Uncharacterized protein n=1 Tax=Acer saccharum TaxID=4024 RepID=A0AA39W8G2_ACESA|nr:hypothetical protein LWI29_013442 [Acer saccharum]
MKAWKTHAGIPPWQRTRGAEDHEAALEFQKNLGNEATRKPTREYYRGKEPMDKLTKPPTEPLAPGVEEDGMVG